MHRSRWLGLAACLWLAYRKAVASNPGPSLLSDDHLHKYAVLIRPASYESTLITIRQFNRSATPAYGHPPAVKHAQTSNQQCIIQCLLPITYPLNIVRGSPSLLIENPLLNFECRTPFLSTGHAHAQWTIRRHAMDSRCPT